MASPHEYISGYTYLSVCLLLSALFCTAQITTSPAPVPAVSSTEQQYLELQLNIKGDILLEELQSLTTSCLPTSSVTAREGCVSSDVAFAPAPATSQGTAKCSTVTVYVVTNSASTTYQDSLLFNLVTCIQTQAFPKQVTDLDVSGIKFATSVPRAQNSSQFEYLSEWQECSASCGGGTQERALLCFVEEGLYATTTPQCAGFPAVPMSRQCSQDSCDSGGQWVYGPWAACSKECGGGLSTRTAQCTQTADVLRGSVSACTLGAPAPLQRSCNVQSCEVYTWRLSPWTNCSASCDGGVMTRDVNCTTADGLEVDATMCEGDIPASSMPCGIQPCNFCSSNQCSSRGTCLLGYCNCNTDHYGRECEVPMDCESGVADTHGVCCPSGVLNAQGRCCPEYSTVDGSGQCCQAGALDVCGVCGGNATTVDVQGTCCDAVLDAQGLCCWDGLDECGVCGGVGDSCALSVEFAVELVPRNTSISKQDAMADFDNQLSYAVGLRLSIPHSAVSVIAAPPTGASATTQTTTSTVWINPSPDAQSQPFSVPSAQRLLAMLNGSVWMQSSLSVSNAALTQVWRVGICGNGICEIGERDWPGTAVDACPDDCPLAFMTCPTVNGTLCGSRGRCFTGSGVCDCHAGYTGPACESCAAGFASANGGSCLPYAPDLLILNPVLGYFPPPPSPPPKPPSIPPSQPPKLSPAALPPASSSSEAVQVLPSPQLQPVAPGSSAAGKGPTSGGTMSQTEQPTIGVGGGAEPPYIQRERSGVLKSNPPLEGPPPASGASMPLNAVASPGSSPNIAAGQAGDTKGFLRGTALSAPAPLPNGVQKNGSFFGTNVGGTVGIVIGLVLLLVAAFVLSLWFIRHRRFRHRIRTTADAWQSGSSGQPSSATSPAASALSAEAGPKLGLRAAFSPHKAASIDVEKGEQRSGDEVNCGTHGSWARHSQGSGIRVWRLPEDADVSSSWASLRSGPLSPLGLRKAYSDLGSGSEDVTTPQTNKQPRKQAGVGKVESPLAAAQRASHSSASPTLHKRKLPKRPALYPVQQTGKSHFSSEIQEWSNPMSDAGAPSKHGPLTSNWNVVNSPIYHTEWDNVSPDAESAGSLQFPDWLKASPPQPQSSGPSFAPSIKQQAGKENSSKASAGDKSTLKAFLEGDYSFTKPVRQPLGSYQENALQWDSISTASGSPDAAVTITMSRMVVGTAEDGKSPQKHQTVTPAKQSIKDGNARGMLRTHPRTSLQYLSDDGSQSTAQFDSEAIWSETEMSSQEEGSTPSRKNSFYNDGPGPQLCAVSPNRDFLQPPRWQSGSADDADQAQEC